MKYILASLACLVAFLSSADARPRSGFDPACNITMPCEGAPASYERKQHVREAKVHTPRSKRMASRYERAEFGTPIVAPETQRSYLAVTILPHPAGCPARAFCGCGAALDVFGSPIRSLWLASNWFGFPRAERASGMAMVRSHHVAILKQHVEGTRWLVADYNSGGHQSRLHVRDTAGWTIVNPRGGNRYASL